MTRNNFLILLLLLIPFSGHASNLLSGQQSFEFHGYLRSGLGLSQNGDTQAKFQAPGTRASYRLGNEPDTNIELQLNYNYEINDPELENASVQGVIMFDGYKSHGESNDFSLGNLAQGYLSFNQFFNNDIKLWFGRRYYDRKDIHIMDHTWLNPGQKSQAGVGIENVTAGTGKLNIALFRYEDNFEITGTPYLINSTSIDVRWHELHLNQDMVFTLWAGFTARHELASLAYASQSGVGLGGWLDYKKSNKKNTLVLIYQAGPAVTQGDYNAKPIREDLGWDLDNATSVEISNTLTIESSPDYSVQWTLMFRQEDHGVTGDSKFNWYSTGARPVYYFSNHLNLAIEAGVDYIDDKINNRSGTLTKLTTALQTSAGRGFYNRPVLRYFITLASWSDELKGLIGNTPVKAPYGNDTQGWTIGVQGEAWW